MIFIFAQPPQLSSVKALLADCGLPCDDLDEQKVLHFLTCRTEGVIAGTVGMEIFGETGLLRGPAVVPGFRGRGIGSLLLVRIERFAALAGVRNFFAAASEEEYLFARGYRSISPQEVPPSILTASESLRLQAGEVSFQAKELEATKVPASRGESH